MDAKDPLLSRVMDLVLHGGLGSQAHSVPLYGLYEHELSVQDGCLLHGNRVVIPPAGQAAVLELLHEGHSGATRTKSLAPSFVWWPGIGKDVEEMVKRCDACQLTRNNLPAASLHPWEFPDGPWERVHADFASSMYGEKKLLLVDAHSKWMEVKILSTAASAATIEALHSTFATHGIPKMFITDNGTQFTSAKFAEFMEQNGIRHVKSAPYHPASNGLAERSVQTAKQGHQSDKDSLKTRLSMFLLWYRLTPHSTTGI